jgi:hypothetical protein
MCLYRSRNRIISFTPPILPLSQSTIELVAELFPPLFILEFSVVCVLVNERSRLTRDFICLFVLKQDSELHPIALGALNPGKNPLLK